MSDSRQAILFDLDGTLLDTAPEFTACMNRLLAEESCPLITLEGLRPSVSAGSKSMIEYSFGSQLESSFYADLRQRFLNYYRENIGFETYFFNGITNLLQALQEANLPWGIVTNKPTEFTLPLIQKFPPLNQAHVIISGDTLKVSKPHPDPLLLAASQLGVDANQCWYVGDARTDVEASRAAGMRCAVANYGYIPPNENALHWQADHYLDQPEQMLKLLFR